MIKVYGKSDTGLKRNHNEDYIGWSEEGGLAILADGMGGHNAGEVASKIAVTTIQQQLLNSALIDSKSEIKNAIDRANEAINYKAKDSLVCAGMGTTVVVVLFNDSHISFGHVGDSRLYRLRDNVLEQLTSDHSLVQEMVDEGFMNQAEARESVSNNVITRALGTDSEVQGEIQQQDISQGDRYLLCSDGLSDMIESTDIHNLMGEASMEVAVDKLIALANVNGGSDNISVILVEIV
ncbi:MAG: Stp1/IreP family PP2C-type Ser/Thr phosphatase [Chromatiales bacterium]|nr:Stp1/IreP family PP2C-type Ser/Thr phosphatase [Chromatiales bacterium]